MSNGKDNKVLSGSGLLLAVTSSLCCIVPLLAMIGGAGGMVSAFSRAAPLRPYLLAATALVLGFSFYRAYRPQRKDDCGCEERKSGLQSKTFLWVVAVVSVLLSTFPYYAGVFEGRVASPVVASTPNVQQAVIRIKGMGCADCEGLVNHALLQRKGVQDVHTSYAKGEAVVHFDPTQVSLPELGAAIEQGTGYQVIR
jgi:mercuric ion transport protein